MSVNIDTRGEGVKPTLKTSRMSVYLSDTGNNHNNDNIIVSNNNRSNKKNLTSGDSRVHIHTCMYVYMYIYICIYNMIHMYVYRMHIVYMYVCAYLSYIIYL